MIETKHRKIVKMLLVFLIKRAKDVDAFMEKVNNLDGIFDLTIELKKEAMPIIPLTELLKLDSDDSTCDKMCDRIYEIIEKEGNENDIENEVEEFMKDYDL